MGSEGRVVVLAHSRVFGNGELGTFAARIQELGLTAYGTSPQEASAKVQAMFALAVQVRRDRGELAKWLDRSGVNWSWADAYQGNIPVTDADAIGKPKASKSIPSGKLQGQWNELDNVLPMAA